MKGFIEVTLSSNDKKEMVNVIHIQRFSDKCIDFSKDNYIFIKESYEEIKRLIEETQS